MNLTRHIENLQRECDNQEEVIKRLAKSAEMAHDELYSLNKEREEVWIPLLEAAEDVYGTQHRDRENTAMDEECNPQSWEYEIWRTGQVPPM